MQYRILLIDENKSASDLILSALANEGFDYKTVKSLDEASLAMLSFEPHVLIFSSGNDEVHHLNLIGTLKSQKVIPIIVVCDSDVCEKAMQVLTDDTIDFLVLPNSGGQIRRVVRRAAEKAELESRCAECKRALEERERRLSVLEKSLQQTERMAALGGLTAGVAHDINTPLGSISSNNDVLTDAFEKVQTLLKQSGQLKEKALSEESIDLSNIIEDTIRTNRLACNYIERIVNGLRNFAHGDRGKRRKANIHERIEIALALTAHELKHRIHVTKEFGNIPQVECYPEQLDQVFVNILANASQAISGQGEIKIRTWEVGDTVRIAITDTGCGIPAELHDRIFEPGFTTKKTGTGLGLSICRKIITDHGGSIELKSQLEKGSMFIMVLPVNNGEEKDKNG